MVSDFQSIKHLTGLKIKSSFVEVVQHIHWLAGFSCRWATQGFDFLQAIEPAFISALPEDDFLVCLLSSSLAITFLTLRWHGLQQMLCIFL